MSAIHRGLIAFILLAGSAFAQPVQSFRDDFSAVPDGTPLGSVKGWAFHYGDKQAATVSLAAGYEGPGVRFTGKGSYRRTFDAVCISGPEASAFEFHLKLRVMADSDAYSIVQALLGETGGIDGVVIRFNGGTKDGWEDNSIQVSTGGANWGSVKFRTLPGVQWRKGRWYEVVFKSREASDAAGVCVSVIELADGAPKTLVDSVPVEPAGGGGVLAGIDTVVIGTAGAARTFDLDDVSLALMRR